MCRTGLCLLMKIDLSYLPSIDASSGISSRRVSNAVVFVSLSATISVNANNK